MTIEIALKVVPGASRTRVVGMLGDRVKMQVCAPPEKGKANTMVEKYLAVKLALPKGSVKIVKGETNPLKTVVISNTSESPSLLLERLLP